MSKLPDFGPENNKEIGSKQIHFTQEDAREALSECTRMIDMEAAKALKNLYIARSMSASTRIERSRAKLLAWLEDETFKKLANNSDTVITLKKI